MLGNPAVNGVGPTREDAICQAEASLRQAISSGEIVIGAVEVPELNPWVEDAGIFRDVPDEDWETYQQAISDYRQKLTEDDSVP